MHTGFVATIRKRQVVLEPIRCLQHHQPALWQALSRLSCERHGVRLPHHEVTSFRGNKAAAPSRAAAASSFSAFLRAPRILHQHFWSLPASTPPLGFFSKNHQSGIKKSRFFPTGKWSASVLHKPLRSRFFVRWDVQLAKPHKPEP